MFQLSFERRDGVIYERVCRYRKAHARGICCSKLHASLMRRDYRFCVYIMASKSRTLYTGVTNNLRRRVFQHKHDLLEGFTQRYKIHRLVHWESFDDIRTAIDREKKIKHWDRKKRTALIESRNPTWEDLAEVHAVHEHRGFKQADFRLGERLPHARPPRRKLRI